ncbi:MAG TPA: VIT1/CCC1 transporter family protein [Patescibacteria group bacterium]|jgi:predicted membrane protein (TIGR00267 family)|nr:VIT1/CCC1 transporter family protein [Patescibacteria group bacterium]
MFEPHKIGSKLSDIILGGQDGLVSILGLLLGLAAATRSSRIIIAGGLATIFAETLSMSAVAYTSKMASKDHYAAERKREIKEVQDTPESERQEITDIYAAKGFTGKLLEDIVNHITSDKELWIDTMMKEELNLLPVVKHDVYIYSAVVGVSTFSGAMLPLIPFFFLHVHPALVAALILSIVVLAAIGAYKARMTMGKPVKSALEMVIIGMGAAVAGYLIGLLFKA